MSKRESFFLPGRELRVQTDANGSRTIVGIIPYDSESSGLPWTETIAPGAFAEALKAGADVLMLRDHDASLLLGRTLAGTLTLQDAANGLTFSCVLPNTSVAVDTAESIARRDLSGVSFGFTCQTDQWADTGAGSLTRTLVSVTLHEISVCSFAAYPDASASLRSVPPQFRSMLQRSNVDGCECDCASCLDGDCGGCSDESCDDAECAENGCPNQDDGERSSWSQRVMLQIEVARRL